MFTFFEPEEEYKTDKDLSRNTNTKINFLIILILIFVFFIVLVQQDVIKFFKEDPIKENCFFENSYLIRVDDFELELKKIKKTLNDHLDILKELDGYMDSEIKPIEDPKEIRKYEIYLVFKKYSKDKKRIPETLCDHKVVTEYK
jgi:hypothetical protein